MHSFDESALISELATLSTRARTAFAAAAATRQLGNYERFTRELKGGSGQRPREVACQLWADLQMVAFDRVVWLARLDEMMSLLPEESDEWTILHALADDALSSLAYAIRCLLTPEPQEAAWAARRAYEAADQAAIRSAGVQPGLPNTEIVIMSHRFVQRELARQRNDLVLLRAESIDEVQRQAFKAELLTEEEVVSLTR